MFPWNWNIAKSAEAILCRYAVKRLCKFLLKKKLGQYIVADIDLDNLDIQLSSGLLSLSHLALNVNFLNRKLGQGSMFRVKEGSIRSLLLKLPWSGENCRAEVDELELVLELFPSYSDDSEVVAGFHDLNSKDEFRVGGDDDDLGKAEYDMAAGGSVNVHEGVKTIAKMVKWLLTSFCITIRNVIIAFDFDDKGEEFPDDTLVLRVAEIECGACVSDGGSKGDYFLGMGKESHLTNFLKFQGATIDLVQMNVSNASKALLTGEKGGFGGTMKLSIPWNNGSLDTQKVDIELNVDTLVTKLQPSTLKWIQLTWDLLENYKKNEQKLSNANHFSTDSTHQCSPSADLLSSVLFDKYPKPKCEEMVTNVVLESPFISDWVPFSTRNCEDLKAEAVDLGASVDQFFECLDEMRNSQFMGSSGMWGWTCSVFSAISAASNLASGSSNVSVEQQHVQTNLKITLVGLSTILAFSDDNQLTQHKPGDEKASTNFDDHYLDLKFQDLLIDVQVNPQKWNMDITVKHIVLNDYFSLKDYEALSLHVDENVSSGQSGMIRALQEKVLGVLPSNLLFAEPLNMVVSDASKIGNAPTDILSIQNGACGNIVKATLFETSGASHCLTAVSSKYFDGQSTRQVSFSLKLPPFILWVDIDLVNMVLDFSRALVNSAGNEKSGTDFSSKAFEEKQKYSPHSNVTSAYRKESLTGSIFLPHAKVVLCFPFKNGGGLRSYVSCDQFIALYVSSPSNFKAIESDFAPEDTCWKRYTPSFSYSIQLNVVNLDVYHLTSSMEGDCSCRTSKLISQRFCSHRILSLGNGTHSIGLIHMLWLEEAVTGAGIMKIARVLATSDGSESNLSSVTSDYEFTSVSAREDKGHSFSQKQKELILSSKFCLHVCVPSMVVTLCKYQFIRVFDLLSQAALSSDTAYVNKKVTVNQSSVFVECGQVEIHIELDLDDCLKKSSQRELPGSWHRLRLETHNLQVLTVSDVGAVSGASFLWVSHREGKLWGSITSLADEDVLLISCCNSSNKRGDGAGSNVLSCSPAGSDFVHMYDPETFHYNMSIVLKCDTIIAPGGRLDWLDKILLFFSLPSPETGQIVDCNRQKADSGSLSFVLKFMDVALSYEPYFCELDSDGECLNPKSRIAVDLDDNYFDPGIACLLAASSLTVSSTMIAGGVEYEYSIKFRDVGLLLHAASRKEKVMNDYCVDHLHELGYVKVAGDALIDAILRINCENDIYWELNCSVSQVVISTCHDTAHGLIHLSSQIQQLFAPDMEESLVHLEGEDDGKGLSETCSTSTPKTLKVQQLGPDPKVSSGLVSLMDEISEDAFSGITMSSFDKSELHTVDRNDVDLCHEGHSFAYPCLGNSMEDGHSLILQEGNCLSGLRSLSELTINSHFPEGSSWLNLENRGDVNVQRGKNGWYGGTSLRILDNYVPQRTGQSHSKQIPKGRQNYKEDNDCQRFKGRLHLQNVDIKWQMFAGSDWLDLGKYVRHSTENCGRDETVCLELALSNMNVHYSLFPDGDLCVSKLSLSVQDLHLYDQSIKAPWKLVLGYYNSKERPRQSSSKGLKVDLEAVRPDPTTPLEEYRLRLAVLPMLLHLHQNQVDFLISFFGNKYFPDDSSSSDAQGSGSSDGTIVDDSKFKGLDLTDEALLPYFQKFEIWPIILRVDYHPSHFDLPALSGGKYVELVNLVHWKGVELHLKHIHAAGVYGWSNACESVIGEWLEDISENQIHKLLQGLPTVRSFVTVGSGAAKLVSLPVKNYRKDHRLVKGLQRGTVAFLRSISVEALGLGVHLAAGAHEILLHAECIVARTQPSLPRPIRKEIKRNMQSDQPDDAQHGLRQACESLRDGLGTSASALIHAPMKTYQRGAGASSAIVSAVRGSPVAAIAPASAAAQALRCALLGVRNSLDPGRKEESVNKYLGLNPNPSCEQI